MHLGQLRHLHRCLQSPDAIEEAEARDRRPDEVVDVLRGGEVLLKEEVHLGGSEQAGLFGRFSCLGEALLAFEDVLVNDDRHSLENI